MTVPFNAEEITDCSLRLQMNVLMQTMSLIDKRLARNERQMAELRSFVLAKQGAGNESEPESGSK